MLKCEKLLGKNILSAYYEFNFAMALAVECGRRGDKLDMTGIRLFDKDMLSNSDLEYMHYLKDKGYIYDGSNTEGSVDAEELEERRVLKKFFDDRMLTDLGDRLVEDKGDYYFWCTEYAYGTYGKYVENEMNKKRLGNTVLHIAAHMYLRMILGEIPKKEVQFFYKSYETCTISLYQSLLACEKSIPTLNGIIKVVLDENYIDSIGDVDFNLLVSVSIHSGRFKKWSCSEKIDFFEKYGLGVGSICVLYERGRMNESNMVGMIEKASVVRVDDYFNGLNCDLDRVDNRYRKKGKAGWVLTKYNVDKTKEEMLNDYYGIDEEYRGMFTDLLKPTLNSMQSFVSFENIGIGTYFYDEEYILMPIEKDCLNKKLVTIDGKKAVIDMDDVDAIYWILNQFKVDFNKEWFKGYYNGGKELLWDLYNGGKS